MEIGAFVSILRDASLRDAPQDKGGVRLARKKYKAMSRVGTALRAFAHPTARRLRKFQRRDDLVDDIARARLDRGGDRALVGTGLLQGLELAVQQARRHEVTVAGGHASRDQRLAALQIDETYVPAAVDDDVAIAALERRAGEHDVPAGAARFVDERGDGVEPRPAVLVGERDALVHLLDIGGRVEPIAVLEFPAEAPGQQRADGALAGARDAHDDEGGDARGRRPLRRSGLARGRTRAHAMLRQAWPSRASKSSAACGPSPP